jgi:hypothetical protein
MPRSGLEDLMHPLTMSLAADHIRELINAAEAERCGAAGRRVEPRLAARWRRGLGAGAQQLSLRLADLAMRLDPPGCLAGQGVTRYGAE